MTTIYQEREVAGAEYGLHGMGLEILKTCQWAHMGVQGSSDCEVYHLAGYRNFLKKVLETWYPSKIRYEWAIEQLVRITIDELNEYFEGYGEEELNEYVANEKAKLRG